MTIEIGADVLGLLPILTTGGLMVALVVYSVRRAKRGGGNGVGGHGGGGNDGDGGGGE
ncbi:hypothetical protein SAMN02982929_05757 [Saccharopolyspora kobensis]|uniref:Uncharacterized protein n=1 Tax=Saccharopolyspora kobensis TaxID=146035 RepID=A0A1H6E8K0_9PSEU|nr:hypothetical protein [Saccharopolyspora kobensis]SEG93185.1 hypothetical protein SAMN02982929_05757 [Saccharopolyspora kobensis]SFD43321.1 hypothetical protein SAMN05216506_104286 [Saccharopolyspora kobensis]